jgi:hypothetical protein
MSKVGARPILVMSLLASWTAASCASSNLTAVEHERAAQATADHDLAARHLARAQELRGFERQLCAGIADPDRDLGPFAHPELIDRVEPILERLFAKAPPNVPVGAIIHLRATPGMTEEWLQRIVDCHLAHHAVLGETFAAHSACPMLATEPPQIRVRSTGNGFAVYIRSSSLYADEILQRSRALTRVP